MLTYLWRVNYGGSFGRFSSLLKFPWALHCDPFSAQSSCVRGFYLLL